MRAWKYREPHQEESSKSGRAARGIETLGRQDEDYGNFAWILDCDGIKIELWQQKGPAPA